MATMTTAMEGETETEEATTSKLIGLSDDLFWEVLGFLEATDIATLGLTNRLFSDPAHSIWFAVALSLCGKDIVVPTDDNGTDDSDVNWKNVVALSLNSKMPPLQFKDVLNDHILAWGGTISHSYLKFTNLWKPELYIPAAGMHLNLPLDPIQLRALIDGGYCEQTPVDRGTSTSVDLESHKGKRLMLGKDVLVGDEQGNGFPGGCTGLLTDSILHQIQEHLAPHLFAGGGKVWAQPYSMLIYEAGDFFKPHRDALRGKHHFGSLVVLLPVQGGCDGGEFILTHGSSSDVGEIQQVASFMPPGIDDNVTFLAFSSDICHLVRPVMSGLCVSLTFHLWAVPPASSTVLRIPQGVSYNTMQTLQALFRDGLQRHFRHWKNRHRFVFPLYHKYFLNHDGKLHLGDLRGCDSVLFCLLKAAIEADTCTLKFSLGSIFVEKFEKPDDPTKYQRLRLVRLEEDKLLSTSRASDQTVWLNQERFLTMHHTPHAFMYFNTSTDRWVTDYEYNHSCIVIRSEFFSLEDDDSELS